MVILSNLALAGLRLGLKNYQVGEKWILVDYLYLCKGLGYNKPINLGFKLHLTLLCSLRQEFFFK
ncbi:hypothetical protein THERMOT_1858 [Bathymodiolus thermophilus thioautotrophic gill symbiont]|nr:hypothetical protein THERMOT_1858 [Bathymodiolus thermophilus thioautotrophic gill symbiont]